VLDSAYNARFGVARPRTGSNLQLQQVPIIWTQPRRSRYFRSRCATASLNIDLPSVKRGLELLARGSRAPRDRNLADYARLLRERGGSGPASPVERKSIRGSGPHSLPRVCCHRVYIKPRSSAYAQTRASDASSRGGATRSMVGRLGVCRRGVVSAASLFLPPPGGRISDILSFSEDERMLSSVFVRNERSRYRRYRPPDSLSQEGGGRERVIALNLLDPSRSGIRYHIHCGHTESPLD
jgi:hypothetical protein